MTQAAHRCRSDGPIVRDIDIQYIGPKTVAKSVILSNMRTTVGEVYSAASVEEDVRNLYATGFFTNLAIKDEPLGDGVQGQRRRPAEAAGEGNRHQRARRRSRVARSRRKSNPRSASR